MIINLLPKKECVQIEGIEEPCVIPTNNSKYAIALPSAYFFGLFFCRAFMVIFSRKDTRIAERNSCCDEFKEVIFFWQNNLILSNL
jgi:hypothetical protein